MCPEVEKGHRKYRREERQQAIARRIRAMWQELSAGFLAAPLWAQGGMAFFALAFVVMVVSPGVTRRRHAERLAALATAAGASTTRRDAFTEWFTTEVEGRRFEVRRELRSSGRGSSYRGPTGHLLFSTTPLAGSRWKLHQIEILQGRRPKLFGPAPLATGDAGFDARFTLRQDGVPVRDGWLDQPTRAAVTAFFDTPWANGSIWVQEEQLQHIMSPWVGFYHESLLRLLRQQATLATALERTAAWRVAEPGVSSD